MDEQTAEVWRRHLANQVAIRGLMWWVVALIVVLLVAVAVGAYAIVTAVNNLQPSSPV